MWPLRFFESDSYSIPEIDNPPTCDGIILYLISLALITAFTIYLNKGSEKDYRRTILCWGIYWCVLIFLFIIYIGFVNMFIMFSSLVIMIFGVVFVIRILNRSFSSKVKRRLVGMIFLIWVFFCVGFSNYYISYVYWLPSS